MTKYERYTSKDGATLTMSQWGGSPAELELYRKLAETEDKIENGTLVELPLIQQLYQGVWEVYFFNTRMNGVMCYLFTDEDAAEAKFRELKGERE